MLTTEQTEFFWEQGYLHIPEVFRPQETDGLSGEMNRLMEEWANRDQGWFGPWRKVYMDEETEKSRNSWRCMTSGTTPLRGCAP